MTLVTMLLCNLLIIVDIWPRCLVAIIRIYFKAKQKKSFVEGPLHLIKYSKNLYKAKL